MLSLQNAKRSSPCPPPKKEKKRNEKKKMPLILKLLSGWGVTWPFQREYSTVRDFCFFFLFPPTLLFLKHFTTGLGGGSEIGSQCKAYIQGQAHTVPPMDALILKDISGMKRYFLTCRVCKLNLWFQGFTHPSSEHWYACINPLDKNSPASPQLAVHWRWYLWNGQIHQCFWNVLPYSFVCFMLNPFSSAAHQVSDGIIYHHRRLVFYMGLLKFVFIYFSIFGFYLSGQWEKGCKSEEWTPYIVTSPDHGMLKIKRKWKEPI